MSIGNSILPSSSPEILRPMPHRDGLLQVVPLPLEDTHTLVFIIGKEIRQIASHPNGHSCHSLAKRIISKDAARIKEQAEYIVRCGGKASKQLL